jgi:hypothetical protein
VLRLDEAKALGRIEELDRTAGTHVENPFPEKRDETGRKGRTLGPAAQMWGKAMPGGRKRNLRS